jgi:hypothetical protein
MDKDLTLSGAATAEQIAAWKRLYGDVFQITVEDKVCYLKRPDRATMSACSTFAEKDEMRLNEVLIENCWLGGDEEVKTNDRYFLPVIQQLGELLRFGTAEIKKL